MNIAIDLDGVCADFVKRFLEFTNIRYNHTDHPDMLEYWDWWKSKDIQITEQEWMDAFEEFTRYRKWQSIEVIQGAVDALCILNTWGFNIYYLTDRPKEARRATLKFLLKNGFPIDSVIFAKSRDKCRVAKSLDIEIGVDDKPDTVQSYHDAGIQPILIDCFHNRKYDFKPDSWEPPRFTSLVECLPFFEKWALEHKQK